MKTSSFLVIAMLLGSLCFTTVQMSEAADAARRFTGTDNRDTVRWVSPENLYAEEHAMLAKTHRNNEAVCQNGNRTFHNVEEVVNPVAGEFGFAELGIYGLSYHEDGWRPLTATTTLGRVTIVRDVPAGRKAWATRRYTGNRHHPDWSQAMLGGCEFRTTIHLPPDQLIRYWFSNADRFRESTEYRRYYPREGSGSGLQMM